MKLNRENIFKKHKWLKEQNRPFIISSDYDGFICASFLSHYFNWNLVGYYDYNSIWLSDYAIKNKQDIIWVDLNILPKTGKSIGGHIVSINNELPKGFSSSCNPNVLGELTNNDFKNKFPFSTLIFLFWLHDISIKNNDIEKLLILHSDNTWMKIQKYSQNIEKWTKILNNYSWGSLLKNINTIEFEKKIDMYLYPKLIDLKIDTKFSKLTSNHLNIKSREIHINPAWDTDVMLKLFNLFAVHIGWTPPELPKIIKRINGKKNRIEINKISKIGLNNFLSKEKVFSYAIISPFELSYTIFNQFSKE